VPKEEIRVKSARIIIKKYENRRLYNTSKSRYINLDELAELVRAGTDIQVVDAKTGEDLTRLTLMQVIVEDAKEQPAGLPLELLRQLIVASNHVGREFLMWYLKSAFDTYHKIQGALEIPLGGSSGFSPLQMVKNLAGGAADPEAGDELQELKQRIAELESRQKTRANKKAPPKAARKRVARAGSR
jgi:polyhydroxyalkanoate synthesis repressor PhaR